MRADPALVFCQTFRQDEINILANLPLFAFRNSQLHTGSDRHPRNNLPTTLIHKMSLFMVRLELLITNDPFDLRDDLLFRKHISRKG